MQKIRFRLVYNRKKKLDSNGKALVQIELYQEKKRRYVTTGVYLRRGEWCTRTESVKMHVNSNKLNYYLRHRVAQLEEIELDLWRKNEVVSMEQVLAKQAKQADGDNTDLLAYYEKCVKRTNIKESTKQNRLSTLKLLRKYYKRLCFEMVNPTWIKGFEQLLREKIGLRPNTVAKHIKHLHICINCAMHERVYCYEQPPFAGYKMKTERTKRTCLNGDELKLIEEAAKCCEDKHYLDAFLFCCYTGLRYSDFSMLSSQDIETINGEKWVVIKTRKTNHEVHLPLQHLFGSKAMHILHKYAQNLNRLFSLPHNSNINKYLKKQCAQIGIHKSISFHTARHTFATLLLQQGVSVTTVQHLLGHNSVRTTQIYAAVTDRTIVADLMRNAPTARYPLDTSTPTSDLYN